MSDETYQACVAAIKKRIEFINWAYSTNSPQAERAGLIGIGYAIDALARRFIRAPNRPGHIVPEIVSSAWILEWYFNYCKASADVCRVLQNAVRDNRLTLRSSLTRTALDEKSINSWLCGDIGAMQIENSKGLFPGVLNLSPVNDLWPDAVGKPSGAAYAQDIAEWAAADGLVSSAEEVMQLLAIPPQSAPTEPQPPAKAPISRAMAQDAAILNAIRELGFDPLALPKSEPGKRGVRADIRAVVKHLKDIFVSAKVFDEAWQRLRNNEDIRDK